MTDSTVEPALHLDVEQVADFLQKHPEFFVGRDDLLAEMKLYHQSGSAISLIEKQLQVLRDRDEERQRRMNYLVATARDNDRRFGSLRKMTLSLLESRDIEQAVEAVSDSLTHDFDIEFHHLLLFSKVPKELPVRSESKDVVESILGEAVSGSDVFCGVLDEKQANFLFGKQASEINSIALAPLKFPERVGMLVLGSRDEKQFRANVGTLFISYLGDILSRQLAHLIKLSTNKNKISSKKKP